MTTVLLKKLAVALAYSYVYGTAFIICFLYFFTCVGGNGKDRFLVTLAFIAVYIPYLAINHILVRFLIPNKHLVNVEIILLLTISIYWIAYLIFRIPSVSHLI